MLLFSFRTHCIKFVGGDSKTLMFVQISPNENDVGETLCSLNIASRVRGIELGKARKQVDVGELSRFKPMVELYFANMRLVICKVY
jgi:kinesin family member C2/C3